METDFKQTQPEGHPLEGSGNSAPRPQAAANFDDLKTAVADDLSAARETLQEDAEKAIAKAKDVASEQTSFAVRHVRGVAAALEKVGTELQRSDQREVGRYTRQIGASVQSLAKQMEGRDIGEIAQMAEEFGRKQPLAFLGAAALAGLAASRFLTASARRTPKTDSSEKNGEMSSRLGPSAGGRLNE